MYANYRGVVQLVRTLVLGTRGRAFESRYPDKKFGVCWNWYTGMSKEHVGYAREGSTPSTPTN